MVALRRRDNDATLEKVYLSPIRMNEPEWWGGLSIAIVLARVGYAIGEVVGRTRTGVAD